MSKYTLQLRNYVESGGRVFDFDYPIFDVSYRDILERKIIDTYYFREIGFETIAQFKHYLKVKLNNVMPYYNELYASVGLVTKDNYNTNLNTTEEHSRTVDTSNNQISEAGSTGKSIFSDTPQAKLQGLDYATSINEEDSTTSGTAEGATKTIEDYIIKSAGSGGMRYNADILMEWRKSFINVDLLIIEELNDLFMNIY